MRYDNLVMSPRLSKRASFYRVGLVWLGLGGGLSFGCAAHADDVLPKAPPASKYAKMAAHSPFAPPTAQAAPQATPPPPPVPGWADNLKATMVMQDGNNYTVTVVDSQNPQHLYLTMEPDKDTQMAVVSVKWGANRDDPPTITLRKGKEFAQVRYESGASSPGGNNALGGGPVLPGRPVNAAGGPPIPGGQPFHPPLQNGGGVQAGIPVPSSNAIRRPLIHSAPPARAPVRPGVSPPTPGARPNPGVQVDDDDDDD